MRPTWSRIYAAGGWYTGDSLNVTHATKKLLMIQFGGAPGADDWYRTLDAIISGQLDPRPSIGMIVGLDELPEAIDLARRAQGPPRIVVVRGIYVKRVGAPLAADAYEDHSPPPPPREERLFLGVRERGAGRPTKRDRRKIEELMGEAGD